MSSEEDQPTIGTTRRLYDEAFKWAVVAQWTSGVPAKGVIRGSGHHHRKNWPSSVGDDNLQSETLMYSHHNLMKTGKETKPAGNIHRQQLFNWMGRAIDDRNGKRKLLRDELVTEVLAQLRGNLEHGLWAKRPRVPEKLELRGSTFAFDLPITCFTEPEWIAGGFAGSRDETQREQ